MPRHRRVLPTDRVTLSSRAHDFLHASIRHDRRRRRRRTITVLSVLLILALTAAGIAVIQQDRAQKGEQSAQKQTRIATARQLTAQAESARPTNPRIAAQLGLAAYRIYPDGETGASLVTTLISNSHYANTLTGHTDGVSSVAFAPDGRTLATAGFDGTVILWDLADRTQPRRVGEPLTGHTDGVFSVAFAPDGRTLATASNDSTVILWDLADRTQPRRLGEPLTGHTGPLSSVAFAPDGRTLATADLDSTVILWDLTGLGYLLDHVVERACAIAPGGLDRDEWARRTGGLPYQESCPA